MSAAAPGTRVRGRVRVRRGAAWGRTGAVRGGAVRGRACPAGAQARVRIPDAAAMLLTALLAVLAAFAAPVTATAAPSAASVAAGTRTAAGTTAEGGYRYWSFWLRGDDGSWSYATEGPATQRPEDGDTIGFRFALSEDSAQATRPRGTPKFAAACADVEAGSGSKRVAVRIDFGTRADAPDGEKKDPPAPRTRCARVPENATAAEALAKAATPLRYSSDSMLCAIDHYPARGCGEQVGGSKRDTDGADSGGDGSSKSGAGDSGEAGDASGDGGMSTGLGVGAGVAAIAVLGGAALWQARRRKR